MGHGSTLYLSHSWTQPPKPSTVLFNHNTISSRHVKSFSNIRINLLWGILSTFATSHWWRSPLKAKAPANTVARKEGRLHSQPTRKKRRRKEKLINEIMWQPKEGKTLFKLHHTSPLHQPKPRLNLLESQEHIQVMLCHPQTYVSTWCNACWRHEWMLVTRIRQLPHEPFFSQRTRTFTNHHHPTHIHPRQQITQLAHKITQRPINHRVHSISRILQYPPLHRPYITPPKRKFSSRQACNLIKSSHYGQTSTKS